MQCMNALAKKNYTKQEKNKTIVSMLLKSKVRMCQFFPRQIQWVVVQ